MSEEERIAELEAENTRLYNALNKLLCVGKFDEKYLHIVREAQEAIADVWKRQLEKQANSPFLP